MSTKNIQCIAATAGIIYLLGGFSAQASSPVVTSAPKFIPLFGAYTDARGKNLPGVHPSPARLVPIVARAPVPAQPAEEEEEAAAQLPTPAMRSPASRMTEEQAQQILSIFGY